jgi:uncharacterized protein YjbJ (UPF0337 family)
LEPAFRTNQPALPSKQSFRLCRRDSDGKSLGFRSNRPRTEIDDSVAILNRPPPIVLLASSQRSRRSCRVARGAKMGFSPEAGLSQRRQEMEDDMKPSTTDQVQGKLHEVKGDVNKKVGQVTGNPDLTNEGQAEQIAGNVQKKVGQVEKVLGK